MSQSPPPATNVFDAAKAIVETLKQLDKQQQEQAIRFAGESLGLSAPSHNQPPVGSGQSAIAITPASSGSQTHSTDIKQFTELKAPKSDQQFAAVVAYFYRFEAPESQRKETIDATTLQEAARLAGRKRPPKPKATLFNAKAAGYLDGVGNSEFKINSVGENLVAITLPGNNSEEPSRRIRGRKKVPKKKVARKKTPPKRTKKQAKRGG